MAITRDNQYRVNDMLDTEIPQLPIDVIIHIMSYLSVSDRMSAGLVNQAWHEASLAMKFIDEQALYLGRPHSDNLEEILTILYNATRPFYHFVFSEVELRIYWLRMMSVWKQYGPDVRSLALICCDLSEKMLIEFLKHCSSLRVLRINACRECFMSGRLLEDEKDVRELSEKFQNVQELGLSYNRFLSDALFNRLVATCPNLEILSLMGCQISFHCGLYKKFYPQNNMGLVEASKSVLTFLNILRYLKQQAHKIKHLNFGYTLIDGTALTTLSTMDDLRLESLMLPGCYQLTIGGIKGLTQNQTNLKFLDISFCVRITDASLVCICMNLVNLEVLRLKRCRAVTVIGIRYIPLLRKLKELDISEDDLLTGESITHGICRDTSTNLDNANDEENDEENDEPANTNLSSVDEDFTRKKNLRILSISALNIHEESIESISGSFPNLNSLDISYCFTGVTDKTIQMIFKDLIRLQTLKLSHCDRVSDAGLTGMGSGNHENVEKVHIKTIPIIPTYTDYRMRISLRSRAEEEIVRDADRKREVMKLCEDTSRPLNPNTYSGFSLLRLRSLRELDLSGCNRITDVSLKHAFDFPELKVLNLSQCQQITHVGLDYLSRNNPAIEDLNLNQCHNVSDIGISFIAQRLLRLKRLLIQGCSQLTDHTLDSVKLYCKSLQYLDTRYCRGMTAAGLESLTHLYVHCVKHMEDMGSDGDSYPPPPPPPPMLPFNFMP